LRLAAGHWFEGIALSPRDIVIRILRPLPSEDYFFVYQDDRFGAIFYLLKHVGHREIWAVSGMDKPFAGNVQDFDSYADALSFICGHLKAG